MNKKHELPIVIFASLVIAFFVYMMVASSVFENRFGFNQRIAGVDVSLKTQAEAKAIVEKKTAEYMAGTIKVNNKEYPVTTFVSRYDVEKSVKEALAAQKNEIPSLGLFTKNHPLVADFSPPSFGKILRSEYDSMSTPPIDARVNIGSKTIEKSSLGQRVLLTESRLRIENDLSFMRPQSGYVVKGLEPMVTDKEASNFVEDALQAIDEPILISSDRGSFEIKTDELRGWLKVMPKSPRTLVAIEPVVENTNKEFVYFDTAKVTSYVLNMKSEIDQTKANAALSMVNGNIQVVTPEKIGYVLDSADAIQQIQDAAMGNRSISLKINQDLPDVRSDNLSELGIKELISTGTSDFRGSPANRVHNFRTGAAKFNGVLIKPNEKFSFNTTLGPVDASTGYLPELVILENKTTPQYGGGLCQVSSTAFRAALNAGLPILERTMHAYPVVYYKPYGVDASIYLPKPDLVFRNDTGHYILIQTRIEGTKLYFDFYGTKPARSVTFAGNISGSGAVYPVESVNPGIYDAGVRGKGSFTASVYRFIYDASGKYVRTDTFISKYDSPEKYPH